MESFRAVYRDQQGRTYSCPVVEHDGAWVMVTSDGPQPITHEFQDDVGGTLTFFEYREEEDSRLHVERLPGESRLASLQRSFAEQYVATQRRERQQSRMEAQTQADPRKVEQARELNNEYAAQMRPRGRGAYIIRGEE